MEDLNRCHLAPHHSHTSIHIFWSWRRFWRQRHSVPCPPPPPYDFSYRLLTAICGVRNGAVITYTTNEGHRRSCTTKSPDLTMTHPRLCLGAHHQPVKSLPGQPQERNPFLLPAPHHHRPHPHATRARAAQAVRSACLQENAKHPK